jgi:hypothetical protein
MNKLPYWIAVEEGTPVRFSDLSHMIASAFYPSDEELMAYGAARVNLDAELPGAVRDGELIVRNRAGFGRHTLPEGAALLDSVVFPHDLAVFLKDRGMDVRLIPRANGPELWTLENAAIALAEQLTLTNESRGTLLDQMVAAANEGNLIVRHPHTDLPANDGQVRESYELTRPEDVNSWLESEGATYRWSIRTTLASGHPKVSAHEVASAPITSPLSAEGVKKSELQISEIISEALALGYEVMSVPESGKIALMKKCMLSRPDLFGAGKHPFLRAWKLALNQKRLRTANHFRYGGK